ncbi:hypothetical protein COZ97_01015 [bacterium CG_4_8_14_3_um_filter_33_28]|nr:MAG: hypothetical protein AUJ93_04275 [bacterium CG2_30_33_46]PIR67726.1 MAG: hypothetical protein COU50_01685 [bacterium CG10_big_fil_rev_8_21_14_0_10_33_18]PIW81581.1 MAG: hypothetical protein COZ97_01015 [bacterium CG_4_8_14_3_um_filter_33_28]PJA72576.1 MAG: hypothetical protein CO152_00870 [bacterium CG_4_9_14_3_um_filter_33_26]
MKLVTIKMTIITILISILIATLIGCAKQPQGHTLTVEEKERMGQSSHNDLKDIEDTEEIIDQLDTPIWTDEDLALSEEMASEANYSEVFPLDPNKVPPFYKEKGPFQYAAFKYFVSDFSSYIDICYEFTNFASVFVYDSKHDFIAKGARTVNRTSKELIAEARLLPNNNNSKGQFKVEEFHYNSNGNIVFRCISTFNPDGWKMTETEAKGTKTTDYYFIWPSQ